MDEENRKNSCRDNDTIYPHGMEFCHDVYCIRCEDGVLELHPQIGHVIDLDEIW